MRLLHDDTDQFFEYGIHIPSRTIVMGPDVDEDGINTEYFLKGMALLHAQETKKNEPIRVIMNNMGGDVYHGLAIYDAIASSPAHVTIECYGHAMSMGGWILQAADSRILAPNATFMMHVGRGIVDSPASMREWDRTLILMEDVFLEKIRDQKPKFTRAALRSKLEGDWFLTATETVAWGLADALLPLPSRLSPLA